MNAYTNSGIPAIGDISWGSHFCNFFQTTEDLEACLIPFFKAGLENNEKCFWVTAEPFNTEDVKSQLRNALPKYEKYIKTNQLTILNYKELYLKYDINTLLKNWLITEENALAQGYTGLRVSGNGGWLESCLWSKFMHYEDTINSIIVNRRIIGLCSYCLDKCSSENILQVIRYHQFALIHYQNEWEIIENAQLKIAKEQLLRTNEELENHVAIRTQELEEAIKARDEFLSIASHELKTPITSLELYLKGILRSQKLNKLSPTELNQKLCKVLEQTERLTKLINQLLDIEQLSTKFLSLNNTTINLTKLTSAIIERYSNNNCLIILNNTQPVIGDWDPIRIDQVLTNLLANAIKYAPQKQIEVLIEQKDNTAIIQVKDQGAGISPKDQERIFDRFVRLTSCHSNSLGLGLWIAKQIVIACGGNIYVKSEMGKGSIFTVELPIK